jgi:hypothetical protein
MKLSLYALVALLALTACSTPGVRQNNANRLAMPVFMIPRVATIDGYQTALRTPSGQPVRNHYIEDPRGFRSRHELDNSPTLRTRLVYRWPRWIVVRMLFIC